MSQPFPDWLSAGGQPIRKPLTVSRFVPRFNGSGSNEYSSSKTPSITIDDWIGWGWGKQRPIRNRFPFFPSRLVSDPFAFFFAELRLGVMMDSTIAHHNESAQNRHDPSNNATIKKRTSLVDRWSPLSAEPVSIVANYFSPIKSRKETQQARNVAIEMAFGLKRNLWEIPWHWHSKATPPTPPTPSVDAAESPRIESGNRVRR